ncbi:MAG: tetratricopeptide repeat protein, partial [Planctomycetota bacterium]|nr:tetratricopeptide repeat protein [Planctomycetota bacterium]
MFRRHPFKWLFVAAIAAVSIWLRFRTVPVLPGDHLKTGLEAHTAGNFSTAEQHFRDELRLVPEQPFASEQLALLLIRSGRSWEASPHVQTTLSQQQIRQDHLVQFAGDPDQSIDESMLEDWHRRSPEVVSPLIGLARIAFRSGRTDEARELLDRILAESPHDLQAHVVKGHVELATSLSLLPDWNSKLPQDAKSHPGIWFVRGDWCQQAGDPEMATRCFLEGARLNPDDRMMNLRLGQLLGKDKGQPFLERAETLRSVFDAVAFMQAHNSSAQAFNVAESLSSLGRVREASHWGQIAMTSNPQLMRRMTSDRAFADKYRRIITAVGSSEDS